MGCASLAYPLLFDTGKTGRRYYRILRIAAYRIDFGSLRNLLQQPTGYAIDGKKTINK